MMRIAASLKMAFISLALLSWQESFANACAGQRMDISNSMMDAIDSALPCVNFMQELGNYPNSELDAMLRPVLQKGIYNELISRNIPEAECRSAAYSQKQRDSAEMERIYDEIEIRFRHYRGALASLRHERMVDEEIAAIQRQYANDGSGGRSSFAMSEVLRGARDEERDRKRDQLLARIPYGTEPRVAEALRRLDETLPADFPLSGDINAFKTAIYNAFSATVSDYNASVSHFRSLYRPTNCVRSVRPTEADAINYEGLASDPTSCPSGYTSTGGTYVYEEGTARALSLSGSYVNLSEQITNRNVAAEFIPVARSILACEADQYQVQRENLSSFTIVAGIGMAVPGLGPLVVGPIVGLVYAQQLYTSCFNTATGFRVVAEQSCAAGTGLQAASHAADSTNCGSDVLEAAGLLAFSGVGRALRDTERLLGIAGNSRMSAFASARAARTAGSTDDVARTTGAAGDTVRGGADEVASGGQDIVVTGSAGSTRAERAELLERAQRRERAIARAEADIPRATREGDRWRDRRDAALARAQRDIPEAQRIRRRPTPTVTDDNVDEVLEASLRDKDELDQLLRDLGVPNVAETHAAINGSAGGLEGFIRRNPNMTPQQQARLRALHSQLIEDRRELTRFETQRDLDRIQTREGGDATVERQLDCSAINRMWENPPFERGSGCQVVTFNAATDAYCACGGTGGAGNWVMPCAESRGRYRNMDRLLDVTATPVTSAMQLCRRIELPEGSTCIHGGLGPTMAGYGGGAQMLCNSHGAWYDGASNAGGGTRVQAMSREQGFDLPPITERSTVRRIAVVHNDEGVTDILFQVRQCLETSSNNMCSERQIAAIRRQYDEYVSTRPVLRDDPQHDLIDNYFRYAQGDMRLTPRGAFEEGSRRLPAASP